jgi:hypothetical protein
MPEKKEISFQYIKLSDYAIYPVSGALGAVAPNGDIVANLYYERSAIPQTQKHELNEDGTLGDLLESEGKDSVVRNVCFAISMRPHIARSIGEWLIRKAEESEEAFKKAGPSADEE